MRVGPASSSCVAPSMRSTPTAVRDSRCRWSELNRVSLRDPAYSPPDDSLWPCGVIVRRAMISRRSASQAAYTSRPKCKTSTAGSPSCANGSRPAFRCALIRRSMSCGCLRCLLLVMCTHPFAKKALTLHLARGEGRERYFGCNLMHRKVLASSHQHLMAEAPAADVNWVLPQASVGGCHVTHSRARV